MSGQPTSTTPKRSKRLFKIICTWCGKEAWVESDRARFCPGGACKQAAYRARKNRVTVHTR